MVLGTEFPEAQRILDVTKDKIVETISTKKDEDAIEGHQHQQNEASNGGLDSKFTGVRQDTASKEGGLSSPRRFPAGEELAGTRSIDATTSTSKFRIHIGLLEKG